MTRRDPSENWATDRASSEHRRHDGGDGWVPDRADRRGHEVRENYIAESNVTAEAAETYERAGRTRSEHGAKLEPRSSSQQRQPFSSAAKDVDIAVRPEDGKVSRGQPR
jgi:hypothetical protein